MGYREKETKINTRETIKRKLTEQVASRRWEKRNTCNIGRNHSINKIKEE